MSALFFKEETEPWTRLGLKEPSPLNRKKIIGRIRNRLKDGPALLETEPGLFYISFLPNSYIRVARTGPGGFVILKVHQNANYIERLIYLYLNYCRVYRRATIQQQQEEPLYLSTWAATGEPVMDSQREKIANEGFAMSTQKEGNFFHAEFMEVMTVIKMLIDKFGQNNGVKETG